MVTHTYLNKEPGFVQYVTTEREGRETTGSAHQTLKALGPHLPRDVALCFVPAPTATTVATSQTNDQSQQNTPDRQPKLDAMEDALAGESRHNLAYLQ